MKRKPKQYVAGLLFDHLLQRVVLILKLRPDWQMGKWNAVGGKIEHNEKPLGAMIREFREETGMTVADWKPFCVLHGELHGDGKYDVHFFVAFSPDIDCVETKTDERVRVHHLINVPTIGGVPNLRWLIPMALAHWNNGTNVVHEVTESEVLS
jgi:8-oxo-dGTP diphosphatase